MDTYTLPILLEGEHWTLTSVRLKVFDRTVTVEAACPVTALPCKKGECEAVCRRFLCKNKTR